MGDSFNGPALFERNSARAEFDWTPKREPPWLRHIRVWSTCAGCDPEMPRRMRCTTEPDLLYTATVDELATGTGAASKACCLDRDAELERRVTGGFDHLKPRIQRRRLVDRLMRRKT